MFSQTSFNSFPMCRFKSVSTSFCYDLAVIFLFSWIFHARDLNDPRATKSTISKMFSQTSFNSFSMCRFRWVSTSFCYDLAVIYKFLQASSFSTVLHVKTLTISIWNCLVIILKVLGIFENVNQTRLIIRWCRICIIVRSSKNWP